MLTIAVNNDGEVSTRQERFDSFECRGHFLGDHQISLVTGLAASAREFRQPQADHTI